MIGGRHLSWFDMYYSRRTVFISLGIQKQHLSSPKQLNFGFFNRDSDSRELRSSRGHALFYSYLKAPCFLRQRHPRLSILVHVLEKALEGVRRGELLGSP
jgi:hypothetical protein